MSNSIATGIDLCEIERIRTVVEKFGERFLHRIYTEREIASAAGKWATLAGYWAVKEATSKALGTGISGFKWTDIEVIKAPNGKPSIILHSQAAEIAAVQGWTEFCVSISHTNTMACAVVVASKQTEGNP